MATEAQLRSIWQDKLQRFSGNEEHGEEKLALFSQVKLGGNIIESY